jgi:glycosyltransferase involved in cell wall biosynthesis
MERPSKSQIDSPPLRAEAQRLRTGVLIPAFNPGPELGELVAELDSLLGPDLTLVVDDGSESGEFDALERSGQQVLHIPHTGKGGALRAGFAWWAERGWNWAITMDADGQHAPSDLPGFLEAIAEGQGDILLGNRMDATRDMPFLRLWTNRITSWIITRIAKQPIPDAQSGYRAIRLSILEHFPLVTTNFDLESEILFRASWAGFRVVPIPIQTIYRGDEESHISKRRDTLRFVRLVLKARRWRRD